MNSLSFWLKFQRAPLLVWAGVPALVVIAIIWYPFGFSMGGLIEEWDMLRLSELNPPYWSAFPGQATSDLFAARPLTPLPFFIARLIDDRSFLGFHIVLIVACVLKALAGAFIGQVLFRSRPIALALGLLALVYPADTQQIALRNVHINLAVALMLCACAFALRGLWTRHPLARSTLAGAAVVCGLLGSWMYEPAITLYSLPPLILYARFGLIRSGRLLLRRRTVMLAWSIGVLTSAGYLTYVLRVLRSSYQIALSGGDSRGLVDSVLSNAHRLESAATRTFLESWIAAWEIAFQLTVHWMYPALVGILLFGLLWSAALVSRPRWHRLSISGRCLIAGLLAAMAGYAPYLVSESHVQITQRTFLAVAPGAALIVTTLIAAAARGSRVVYLVLLAIPLTLGTLAQAFQHDRYARAYMDSIRPFLEVTAARSDLTKRVHLVRDNSGVGTYLNGAYYTKVRDGLPVITRRPKDTYVLCRSQPLTPIAFFSECAQDGDRWRISSWASKSAVFRAADVDVIDIGAEDMSRTVTSTLWNHLGSFSSRDSLFKPVAEPRTVYECTADSMWGYSGFCPGLGWSDGSVSMEGISKRSRFWAVSPEATLFFRMHPEAIAYTLKIAIADTVPRAIAKRWTLSLNGTALAKNWITPVLLEAHVPAGLLRDGFNSLGFHDVLGPSATTGLSIERVVLVPEGSNVLIDGPPPQRIDLGVRYPMNDALAIRVLQSGFSETEHNGTWTDGPEATVRFSVPRTDKPAVFRATVMPFLNDRHPSFSVRAYVNGIPAATRVFNGEAVTQEMIVPLQPKTLAYGDPVQIRLEIQDPATPEQVGAGNRYLGLFFKNIEVVEGRSN